MEADQDTPCTQVAPLMEENPLGPQTRRGMVETEPHRTENPVVFWVPLESV